MMDAPALECGPELTVGTVPPLRVQGWGREPLDRLLAALLLLLHLPILASISAVLLVTQGRPILYRGRRLGRDRREFVMYKFRTLRPDSESRIGGRVLEEDSGLETPLGRVLRESRIDEIPQLLNILRGDMSFIGPRPVRPLVYREIAGTLPGYQQRFRMKPGLIGPVQLVVPHGASKAIRQRVNRLFFRQLRSRAFGLGPRLFALAFFAFLRCLGTMVGHGAESLALVRRGGEHRRQRRFRPRACELWTSDGPRRLLVGPVTDVSAEALTLRGDAQWPPGRGRFHLEIRFRRHRRLRTRVIRCECVRAHRRAPTIGPGRLVLHYRPSSDHAEYLRDKYLLGRSLI